MKESVVSRRDFIRDSSSFVFAVVATHPASLVATPVARTQFSGTEIQIEDPDGALGLTQGPVCARLMLPKRLRRAVTEGGLALREKGPGTDSRRQIPLQCLDAPGVPETPLCWLLPAGKSGRRVFAVETCSQGQHTMVARQVGGQYEISEEGKPALRYNYAEVGPGDLLNSMSVDNRKYAVARSDYIHPLYGPHGEVLTKDWSVDHPHHRGIYWAWPEVDWRGQRADLHALQKVFARPTGRCEAKNGPVFAQLTAENLWEWENSEAIVRERATIRAYAASPAGRLLDLDFLFEALNEPVLVARRGTSHYGGLNIRLSAVGGQRMTKHIQPLNALPRAAWADVSGTFSGAQAPAGLTVIQHASNPDYPGDWVEYPELNWLQPTFPASGTRYEMRPGKPLRLRFRLWMHTAGEITESAGNECWLAANSRFSPLS